MSGPAVGSYVMAKELPESTTYFTAGRPYLVTRCAEDGLFEITTDRGERSMCLMTNCAHLEGGDWSLVDPLQALEADNAALKAKNEALVEALDQIADCDASIRPGHIAYKSKAQIIERARQALAGAQ